MTDATALGAVAYVFLILFVPCALLAWALSGSPFTEDDPDDEWTPKT